MFHGVVPGVFTVSHIHNHHKYDNDENDVYSTAFRPRDSFASWVKYVPEWMAYATNVSSFVFFLREGSYGKALKTLVSTMCVRERERERSGASGSEGKGREGGRNKLGRSERNDASVTTRV
jgi:hypothetical protein